MIGKPDIVFPGPRVAVFVDGDLWHGYGWRERGFESMEDQFRKHRDPDFWISKIRRNVQRDQRVTRALTDEGWTVLRILESDIQRDVTRSADLVEQFVRV
jgi:DNA mismatch endonuclease (patch repair protein)